MIQRFSRNDKLGAVPDQAWSGLPGKLERTEHLLGEVFHEHEAWSAVPRGIEGCHRHIVAGVYGKDFQRGIAWEPFDPGEVAGPGSIR